MNLESVEYWQSGPQTKGQTTAAAGAAAEESFS